MTSTSLELNRGAEGRDDTVASILRVQKDDGMIPWFASGRADPWNHVEAAMALSVAGAHEAAKRAYSWLNSTQRPDGAWHAAYSSDGAVLEQHLDTNAVAYVATGVYHHWLSTNDLAFVRRHFAMVDAALDFVCSTKREDGMIPWSIGSDGVAADIALLAASASVAKSLASGAELAATLGKRRDEWATAARRLGWLVSNREAGFADKSTFAMDWYYPVLSGAVGRKAAVERLEERAAKFVLVGHGVRCRSDGRWVTAAETAECAVAYLRAGSRATARRLLSWGEAMRDDDGAYLTGLVHPECSEYPPGERSTYSAAAVILAEDACSGGPTAALFPPLR